MASYQIIAWREIPAIVEAHDASGSATRQLSERFQALIDAVAMQLGLQDSEAYLEQWTRSEPAERAGTAAEVADAVAAELEGRVQEFVGRVARRS